MIPIIGSLNPYTAIGLLAGAALLFHMSSKEEVILGILAVVAITYMTR